MKKRLKIKYLRKRCGWSNKIDEDWCGHTMNYKIDHRGFIIPGKCRNKRCPIIHGPKGEKK